MNQKTSRAKSRDPLGALLKGLGSTNPTVRRRAEQALGESRDPQATARLLELLKEQLESADTSRARWIILPTIGQRLANRNLPPDDARPAVRALLELVNHRDEGITSAALQALGEAQPLPADIANVFADRLRSSSYLVASSALGGLIHLPPPLRDKWIPTLLDRLSRFRNNSEWCWIVECLPPHFAKRRERIVPVFRTGLRSKYTFAPHSVLGCLRQLGPAASALVPDVLAYIGRQPAFTNEVPHLIHLDPKGKKAVPGLIRLLRHRKETVRYQAVCELEAYGARAVSAAPILAELANNRKGKGLHIDSDAAQRALNAIQKGRGAGSGARKSPTRRLLGLVDQAIAKK